MNDPLSLIKPTNFNSNINIHLNERLNVDKEEANRIQRTTELTLAVFQNQLILSNILNRLPFRDHLVFEQISKTHQKALVPKWRSYQPNFNWLDCRSIDRKEKWNYLLSLILVQYIELIAHHHQLTPHALVSIPNAQALIIYNRYKNLAQKCFYFHCFMHKHLDYCTNQSYSFDETPLLSRLKRKGGLLPDEKLFHLILESSNRKAYSEFPFDLFTQAITEGYTIASLFAVKLFGKSLALRQQLENLTLQSANQNDYQGFEAFLLTQQPEQLKEMFERLKPALQTKPYCVGLLFARLAYVEPILSLKYGFYSCALGYFNGQAPLPILIHATQTYLNAHTYEFNNEPGWIKTAEKLYTQILSQCQDNIPEDVLIYVAKVKMILRQWKEADEFYMQALDNYKKKKEKLVDVDVVIDVALVKIEQGLWEEAQSYYRFAQTHKSSNFNETVSYDIKNQMYKNRLKNLFFIALTFVKEYIKLQKWKEAENFCLHLLAELDKDLEEKCFYQSKYSLLSWKIDAIVLLNTINIKLSQWEKAKALLLSMIYSPQFKSYPLNVQIQVLMQAVLVKIHFNHKEVAQQIFNHILCILYSIEHIYSKNSWKELESSVSELTTIYDSQVPIELLTIIDFIKKKLEKI